MLLPEELFFAESEGEGLRAERDGFSDDLASASPANQAVERLRVKSQSFPDAETVASSLRGLCAAEAEAAVKKGLSLRSDALLLWRVLTRLGWVASGRKQTCSLFVS